MQFFAAAKCKSATSLCMQRLIRRTASTVNLIIKSMVRAGSTWATTAPLDHALSATRAATTRGRHEGPAQMDVIVMVFVFALLFIAAGAVGSTAGRNALSGGWNEREVHNCGWHERYSFNTHYRYGGPCPGCGSNDKNWRLEIGRPISYLPWGWEWKRDAPSDIRDKSRPPAAATIVDTSSWTG